MQTQQTQQQETNQNNLFLVWRMEKLKTEKFRKQRDRNVLLKRYVH